MLSPPGLIATQEINLPDFAQGQGQEENQEDRNAFD
jgi:hypothetical protein